ncbi:GNAT family N-acetyltransferase [Thermotoga caldifontis]|uniref:GNAT family N-acetyltransferase n=1 Tax=Thermotoga caldifontis TaxID=1508419 RepID=UPI000596F450|nr:GNAT family N-acetyltransferase [Thermotoga caldifontis]
MEGVTIRWVRLSDAPQLVAFKKAVTSESPFLLTYPDEVEDVFEARRYISIYLTDDRRIFLVAEYQGEIVGMITLAGSSRRKILHKAELGISVRKPYWGKGIGSALISEALRIAKQKGFKKIQLEVMEHNERAIRLYKKFGFEIEGRKKKAICMDGQYFDLLVMGKWLED